MEILYFGRLRDEIGRDREQVDLPSHVLTVEDLLAWLCERGEPHASALAGGAIGAAVGDERLQGDDSVFGAAEIALLPPAEVL